MTASSIVNNTIGPLGFTCTYFSAGQTDINVAKFWELDTSRTYQAPLLNFKDKTWLKNLLNAMTIVMKLLFLGKKSLLACKIIL